MADSLTVVFGADIGPLLEGISEAKEAVQGFADQIAEIKSGFSELGEALITAFAVERIADFAKEMAELGDKALNAAAILGTTVEKVTALDGVMSVFGGGVDGASRTMERLGKNIEEAITSPSSRAAGALKQLGIPIEEVKTKLGDEQELLDLLREKWNQFGDSTAKTTAFLNLTGRGLDQLIPYFRKTDEEVEEMRQKVAATGTVLTHEMAEGMERTSEGMKLLGLSIKGDGITTFEVFKPLIDEATGALTKMAQAFSESARTGGTLGGILYSLDAILRIIVISIAFVIAALKDLAATIAGPFGYLDQKLSEMEGAIVKTFGGSWDKVEGKYKEGSANFVRSMNETLAELKKNQAEYKAVVDRMFGSATGENPFAGGRFGPADRHDDKPAVPAAPARGGDEGGQAIAEARERIAEINEAWTLGRQEQLAGAVSVWAALLDGDKLNAKQRADVARQYHQAVAAQSKYAAEQQLAIDKSNSETTITLGKLTIDETKKQLDIDVQNHRITAAQRYEALKRLTEQEYALDIDALQKRLATEQLEPAQITAINNQIVILRAQLNDKLMALAKDFSDAQEKELVKQQEAWRKVLGQVGSAFDTFFSDVLTKQKTIGLAAEQAANKMLVSWVEDIAKILLQWTAFEAAVTAFGAGSNITKAIGNPFGAGATGLGALFGGGGAGGGAAAAQQQLTQAITGNTAETIKNTGGMFEWIAQQFESLAQWLGLTTATTGDALSTDAATATTVGGLIPALTALTLSVDALAVSIDSMGGAGALGSAIPGAAAFLPFLSVGAWNIPQEMGAILHPGEMAVPETQADILRSTGGLSITPFASAAASVASSAAGNGAGNVVVNMAMAVTAVDGQSVKRVLTDQAPSMSAALEAAVRRGLLRGSSSGLRFST